MLKNLRFLSIKKCMFQVILSSTISLCSVLVTTMSRSVIRVKIACIGLAMADLCVIVWLLVTNNCSSCTRDDSVTFTLALDSVALATLYWPIYEWHRPRQNCCHAMVFMGLTLTLACVSFVELFKLWHAKYDTYYVMTIIETVLFAWYIIILVCILCIAWKNNCYDAVLELQNQIQAAEMAVERAEAKRIEVAARPRLQYLEATSTNELVQVSQYSILSGRPNDLPLKNLAELEQWEQARMAEQVTTTLASADTSIGSTVATIATTTTTTTDADTNCTICFMPFTSATYALLVPCKHSVFHQWCINKWLRSRGTCPICRQDISTIILPGDGVITDKAIAAYCASQVDTRQVIAIDNGRHNRNVVVMAYCPSNVGSTTRLNMAHSSRLNNTDTRPDTPVNIDSSSIVVNDLV